MDPDRVSALLAEFDRRVQEGGEAGSAMARVAWLVQATDDETDRLLEGLCQRDATDSRVAEGELTAALQQLAQRARQRCLTEPAGIPPHILAHIRRLYHALPPASPGRAYLLQILAVTRRAEELELFADLIATDPLHGLNLAAIAFSPLLQFRDFDPTALFPKLFEALSEPSVAATVVDLANFVLREGLTDEHPAIGRKRQFANLLGELAQRLSVLEELPDHPSESDAQLADRVEDIVALAVSLCDAAALMEDRDAIGKLYQVLELGHRRLRTEAASALARFGEKAGEETLLALAAEPVARLRVLAYADELGLADRVEEQFATPAARAEAELALWLAQPEQLGIPPGSLELIDSRTQYWPGYDAAIECFLFRFTYNFGGAMYQNLGIAGPLCHAFAADLADLPPDDIYAAFAGWQAEHDEIYERDVADLDAGQRVEVARLERRLRDAGYVAIQSVLLGSFFGDRVLVARAIREDVAFVCVAGVNEVCAFRTVEQPRSIGPADALAIYKGRQLLRSFNP